MVNSPQIVKNETEKIGLSYTTEKKLLPNIYL